MKNNLISIIIPTYKRVIKLKKALNSILKQKYDNWEAIIIDNKSNDGTKELVKEYNDKKFFFYEIENNGIIAKSRNFGISKAKGNYLAFLDSDDWWLKEKLEVTNEYINQGYKFLYHDLYVVKNNNAFKRKTSYCRHLKKPVYEDLINNGPAFPTSSVVVDKELFNRIKNFNEDTNFVIWEDYDAWIRFSKVNENFIKIPKTLGFVNIDESNLLNTDKSIDNILFFKEKYIYEKKIPNWCNFSLLRLYVLKKDFISAKKYMKEVNFFKLSLILKIKFVIFKLLVFFKLFTNNVTKFGAPDNRTPRFTLMRPIVIILLNIKKKGFFKTLYKITKYPYNKFKYNKLNKKIFSTNSIEDRFTKIFKLNYWDNKESVSGTGSDLENTKNIRHKLPQLINQFQITSILDAPCGDFYWMKYVMKNLKIKYLGGDIVTEIINENNKKYKSDIINFQKINIISDKLPNSDLMICRDCLFHFSYEDIFKFFENFINSNIRLLLTTSHNFSDKFFFKNKNILTGDYREIDLFSEPFNFKKNYLLSIEDKVESYFHGNKFLYLFSRKQISEFVKIMTSGHK